MKNRFNDFFAFLCFVLLTMALTGCSANEKKARQAYESIPQEEIYSMVQTVDMGELYDSKSVTHRWQAGDNWLEVSEQTNGVTVRTLSYQGRQYRQMETDGMKGTWEEADLSQVAQSLKDQLEDSKQLSNLKMTSTNEGTMITGNAPLPEINEASKDVLRAETHTVTILLDTEGRLKELQDIVTYQLKAGEETRTFEMSSLISVTGYDEKVIMQMIDDAVNELSAA